MKKICYYFLWFVCILYSCKIENVPNPCYTTNFVTKVNTDIEFDASCSKNASQYEWNFGDGSAAISGQKVVHQYAYTGTYKIVLTVRNGKDWTSGNYSISINQ